MSAREHIFKFGSTYRRGEYFSTANAINLLGVWRYNVILQQERNIMVSYDMIVYMFCNHVRAYDQLYAKMHLPYTTTYAHFLIATDIRMLTYIPTLLN